MTHRVNNLAMGGGVSGAFSITFLNSTGDPDVRTVYTFAGLSFGRTSPNRLIVITIIARRQNETLSSATIGGVSATIAVQSTEGGNYKVLIVYAEVPTGSSGDVVITWSGNARNCTVTLYRVTGQTSNTPTDVDTGGGSNKASPTVDFPSPPNPGVAVYGFINSRTNEDPGTWTNNLTEDADLDFDGLHMAAAHFRVGVITDSAYQRDSDPGVDTWNECAVAGAAWA